MRRLAQWTLICVVLLLGLAVMNVSAQSSVYIVQGGDTLFSIAQRLNLDIDCLVRANGILNPNRIAPGQALNLTPCASPQPAAPAVASTYIIQRGDRLYEVAQRLGVDMNCLVRVNGLTNPARIPVGLVLQVDPCILQGGGAAPLPLRQNYVVQRGDRFNEIAHTFGLDALCLARANRIATPDFLIVGETLILDFARCTAANG